MSTAATETFIEGVKKELSPFTLPLKREICQAIVRELDDQSDIVSQIKDIEQQVRDIHNSLGLKTHCIMGILMELESMYGEAVGVEYGNDLVFGFDEARIDAVLKDNQDDQDLALMGKVHDLVKRFKAMND